MDEAAQQAVQTAVNITIFIIALSISLTLLIGVRDLAEVASEYNASIPTGSRVVSVGEEKKRTVSGYELLSYCANYMTEINGEYSGRYIITIKDGTNTVEADDLKNAISIEQVLKNEGIDLKKEYEVITKKYNKQRDILYITLQSIEG